ncbi:MAG: hypothetical protein GY926_13050 [bacterium]|nr:hypothetical protein [bacterium]
MTTRLRHAGMGPVQLGRVTRTGAVLLVMVMLCSLITASPADATNTAHTEYGQTGMCGDLNASRYQWGSASTWNNSPGLKTEFDQGFDAWMYDVEKWSGGYLLSNSGTLWTARWASLGSSTNATTDCFPWAHNITFNIDKLAEYQTSSGFMAAVSAHEWGHGFGLGHVGEEDAASPSSDPPTMATCVGQGLGRASLSNDDEAAITAQNESISGFETMTANSSFEEDDSDSGWGAHRSYWRTQNVSNFYGSTSGGGADGSPWYAAFKGSASNTAVFADTFITARLGGEVWGRANYKKQYSSDRGHIQITAKYQLHEHDGSSCGKLSNTSAVGGWYAKNVTRYPSANWNYGTATVSQKVGAGLYRVVLARVVVYNRMEKSIDGSWYPQYVKIDRTRVMWDGN